MLPDYEWLCQTTFWSIMVCAMNSVVCPHCKKSFEISDAIKHEMEEKILQQERLKFKDELEKAKSEHEEKVAKKLQEQFSLQLKQAKEEAIEKEQRIKDLLEQLTELNKELRATRREKEEAKLDMQKKLAEEEEKIRHEAKEKAEEEQRLKILEKEKQLQEALKANEDMRRKLQQGSQQIQGEVFEEEFEGILKNQYPNDKIIPISKGVRGGDILHEIWDKRGNYCGKILWELKNTKVWGQEWVGKLKNDKRSSNSDEAILISEVLPTGMKTAGYLDGIWVTQRNFVISLADTIRAKLIQLFYVKNSVKAKDGKMEVLYQYLSGVEFKHRVEAIIEAFTNMQVEIEKEKRYFANKWARDGKNIRLVIDNTYGMHGDFKGILGNVLPQIKGLEMLELGDGNET